MGELWDDFVMILENMDHTIIALHSNICIMYNLQLKN